MLFFFFFFQADDGIRDRDVTGVQTCALPISRRPGLGKALIGDPPQQQGRRVKGLVELELVALVTAGDLERPPSVPEVLGSARILHYAVQRDELGYDDPPHLYLLLVGFRVGVGLTGDYTQSDG